MSFIKRVLGQKGISGVIVALLLILIGVIGVMGINSFISSNKDTLISTSDAAISNALADMNDTNAS